MHYIQLSDSKSALQLNGNNLTNWRQEPFETIFFLKLPRTARTPPTAISFAHSLKQDFIDMRIKSARGNSLRGLRSNSPHLNTFHIQESEREYSHLLIESRSFTISSASSSRAVRRYSSTRVQRNSYTFQILQFYEFYIVGITNNLVGKKKCGPNNYIFFYNFNCFINLAPTTPREFNFM